MSTAQILQTDRYIHCGGLTLLLITLFSELEREVGFIWSRKKGLASVLYLVCRYVPIITVASRVYQFTAVGLNQSECLAVISINLVLQFVGIAAAEGIFCLRTYAIYGCTKIARCLLSAVFTALVTTVFLLIVIYLLGAKFGSSVGIGCYITPLRRGTVCGFLIFAVILLGEIILVVLTMWKAAKSRHQTRTPLWTTLYTEGILFFLFIAVISCVNVITVLSGQRYTVISNHIQVLLHSVLACRVILDLRESAIEDENYPEGVTNRSIDFGTAFSSTGTGLGTQHAFSP